MTKWNKFISIKLLYYWQNFSNLNYLETNLRKILLYPNKTINTFINEAWINCWDNHSDNELAIGVYITISKSNMASNFLCSQWMISLIKFVTDWLQKYIRLTNLIDRRRNMCFVFSRTIKWDIYSQTVMIYAKSMYKWAYILSNFTQSISWTLSFSLFKYSFKKIFAVPLFTYNVFIPIQF